MLATDTWAIAPEEITICRRPDGSEWELGSGAYGRVFRCTWCEQAVAVKKVRGAQRWDVRNRVSVAVKYCLGPGRV